MRPTAIVVAGPNGAGRTTLARELILSRLPNHFEFLNADLIAEGLSPFKPQSVAIRAGKQFLDRLEEKCTRRESFLIESTLSGKSFCKRLHRLKSRGYRIEIIYLWLPTAGFAVKRVQQRVRLGGHNIPEQTILRRFNRSIENFFRTYMSLADSVALLDGSKQPPEKMAAWQAGELTRVFDNKILRKIIPFEYTNLVNEPRASYKEPPPEGYLESCVDQLLEDVGQFLTILEKESGLQLVLWDEE